MSEVIVSYKDSAGKYKTTSQECADETEETAFLNKLISRGHKIIGIFWVFIVDVLVFY